MLVGKLLNLDSPSSIFEAFWESCVIILKGIKILKSDCSQRCILLKGDLVGEEKKKELMEIIDSLGVNLEQVMSRLFVQYPGYDI